MNTLCVDIGGTGIKVIVLNDAGKPITKRARLDTPKPATPRAVLAAIATLAKSQGKYDRVSAGFPGVVRNGVTETAHNLDPKWLGFNLAQELSKMLRKPSRACNDADVQGYGCVKHHGIELVITLGTGLGSALFVDGKLVRNLELAHHPFRKGKTYEERLGKAALKKAGKKKWNKTLRKAIALLDLAFNYDTLFIGGGNAEKIKGDLPPNVKIVSNIAGLTGGRYLWRPPDQRKGKSAT